MNTTNGKCECGCGNPAPLATRSNTKRGDVVGQPVRFIRGHGPKSHGSAHGCWKGGRYVGSDGYVRVRRPEHPRQMAGGYVLEHILVAEAALGSALPEEHPVHHVDEDRGNNANTNLVICEDKAYHNMLHARMRAYDACGDANARRCIVCGCYDRQEDMVIGSHGQKRHRAALYCEYREDDEPLDEKMMEARAERAFDRHEGNMSEGSGGESAGYREAMKNAGRSHLLAP